jgi:erythronate-4-phosphate dehydrogenase
MRIAVDSNIPQAAEAFAAFGEVHLVQGRSLVRDQLDGCDALIVRSTCRVDSQLLEGTRIQFVGTATSGTEHVDTSYLRERGIVFAAASGSNAISVAEYVVLALHLLSYDRGFVLAEKTLGIVGCGHVGREVLRCATALGIVCVVGDPPLARSTAEPLYRNLDEALGCHVVTLHVPLAYSGPDPTYRLLNADTMGKMRQGGTLVNTARGGVVGESALREALERAHVADAIIDVWEEEPVCDPRTAEYAFLATPHIAGHSIDGKLRGTGMMVRALARFTQAESAWSEVSVLPAHLDREPIPVRSLCDALDACLTYLYDPRTDDTAMRSWLDGAEGERGARFDAYRRNYPARREFSALRVTASDSELAERLTRLGLSVV